MNLTETSDQDTAARAAEPAVSGPLPGPTAGARLLRLATSRLLGIVLVVLAVLWWQVAVSRGWIDSPIVPSPADVLDKGVGSLEDGTLLPALGATLANVGIGYGIAVVLGVLIGALMALIRPVHSALEPIVELVRPVPVLAYVPLLILSLGIGTEMKATGILLSAFFPILISTVNGVQGVPATMRQTGETFGLNRWRQTVEIILPCAAPVIFVGLRTSLALAISVATAVDMITGNSGIGYYIVNTQQNLQIAQMYAGIVALAVVGYLINALSVAVERYLLRWHFRGMGGSHG
ncbi:ABC transporter permease [Actinacidiphila sp. ITFR-21]|uniref:ABC transporter permease n=1 Tax=Actinacidiphila sp. ITFR-21 TaxID=3075199 RepID=UPI00288BD3D1|nr:ABC transporter permease [Streptomyces sp. ITFR-21]WNI18763.1 ABC transporter permease [Streptomyces sp. ITFR-21]